MAIDVSEEYLRNLQLPLSMRLHVRLSRPIRIARKIQRRLSPVNTSSSATLKDGYRPKISPSMSAAAEHLREHRWAFVEDFMETKFHERLLKTWPGKQYLNPPASYMKSYNRGLQWARGAAPDPVLTRFPVFNDLIEHFDSADFRTVLADQYGLDKPVLGRFVVTETITGSCLPPHRDTSSLGDRPHDVLNIIYFVDGSGGNDSAGTTLSHDNQLKDVIFAPTKLKNTALIYDTGSPFFHGFHPVVPGKFRKAVIVLFRPEDYGSRTDIDKAEVRRRKAISPDLKLWK